MSEITPPLRRDVVAAVLDAVGLSARVVLANGYVSRDGFNYRDSPHHFYMIGSMGLAAAIGTGIALRRPEVPVVVLDGDGNLLMGLGVLPMVGAWRPTAFLHVVLDNGCYASTGGQPTVAPAVDFPALALASGYRRAASVSGLAAIADRAREWCRPGGPCLLHVQVSPAEPPASRRISQEPPEIARRFTAALREER